MPTFSQYYATPTEAGVILDHLTRGGLSSLTVLQLRILRSRLTCRYLLKMFELFILDVGDKLSLVRSYFETQATCRGSASIKVNSGVSSIQMFYL